MFAINYYTVYLAIFNFCIKLFNQLGPAEMETWVRPETWRRRKHERHMQTLLPVFE